MSSYTQPHETLKFVHRDSAEYRAFLKKLENNYESSNKLSICLMCWGFLTGYQKKKHMSHQVHVVTPSFCRTEDQFLKYARDMKRTRDNSTLIALLNDSCPALVENPYMTPVARPRVPVSFQGEAVPSQFSYQELRGLMQKQFQQDQLIKRLVI